MKDNSNKTDETIDLIRTLKNENENLSKTFKEKLKNMSNETNRTISLLQDQLDESKTEIDRLHKYIDDFNIKNKNSALSNFNNLVQNKNQAERQQSSSANSTHNEFERANSIDHFNKTNNFILGPNDGKIVNFKIFFCYSLLVLYYCNFIPRIRVSHFCIKLSKSYLTSRPRI